MSVPPNLQTPVINAAQLTQVFEAADIFVTSGANFGDGLTEPEDLCPGDVYELDPRAKPLRLALAPPRTTNSPARAQVIADGSEVGGAGDPINLTARLTLMAPNGEKVELLLLRHRTAERSSQITHYVLPLTPISARTPYTLLMAEDPPEELRLSDMLCLSFHRGTRIVLASGAQVPIEQLVPGTKVLTREHGPQAIRWIGRTTLRARGSFAPVVITAGTMGNEADLIVGPHHRLFVYQRKKLPGLQTSELLVQARHFVDGETVYRREAGYAEYFSLVFDRHEIIYAEGIPVESLMVNEASVASLPSELADALRKNLPGLSQAQHFGLEPDAARIDEIRRNKSRSN